MIAVKPATNEAIQPRLLTPKQTSTYLCISERKLWSMSKNQVLPAVKIGRSVRYDIGDLDDFISRSKRVEL